MDRVEVREELTSDSRSNRTAVGSTKNMAPPAVRRGAFGRCVDWILGRSFVLSVLVLALTCDKGDVPDEGEEDW